jgi:dolichol-phosphate mannosyltransferase
MQNRRILVMLPAYNEALNLPSLLNKIEHTGKSNSCKIDVLVVNDGSSDNTLETLRSYAGPLSIDVLDLQPNRGLAGAMREGFKVALAGLANDDILITMDADDSHDPGLIPDMIACVNDGSDLVIASRYRQGARIVGLSRFRKVLSEFAGYLFRLLAPIKGVRDYTCGYRAYSASLIRKADQYYSERFIEQQGFGCMAEILLKLRRFHPVIREVPMILRYDLKRGASKMNVIRTSRQTIQLILKARKMK